MAEYKYHEQVDIDNARRIRSILSTLPPFCREFFRGIENTTSSRTRLAYAYDLRVFFDYLTTQNPALKENQCLRLE